MVMNIENIFVNYINLREKLNQAKIYKIIDNTDDKIYIGCTCKTLKERLLGHKSDYKKYLKGLRSNMTSFDILKNNDYKIELLEDCKIKTKDELTSRERHFIEHNDCVNKVIPGRTDKEYRDANKENKKQYYDLNKEHLIEKKKIYRDANKEKIDNYQKAYRITNRDKIREHKNQKYNCQCGGQYTHDHKARHLRTDRHRKYLETIS